jgi:hypothetical protein
MWSLFNYKNYYTSQSQSVCPTISVCLCGFFGTHIIVVGFKDLVKQGDLQQKNISSGCG